MDVGAAEAAFGGRGEGVDQGEQPAGDGDRAGDVEARALRGAGLGQQGRGQRQHDQREQGEQAHRGAPAEGVREDAAEHHADGEAEREQGAGDGQRPVALRPSGKVVVSRDMPVGTIAAAPRPCRARPARKDAGSQAKVASREAAPNRASPVRNSLRRPNRSPIRPKRSRKPPDGSANAVTAHCRRGLAHAQVLAEDGQRHVQDGEVQGDHELGRAEDEEDEFVAGASRPGGARCWGRGWSREWWCRSPWVRACGRRNNRGEPELVLVVAPPARRSGRGSTWRTCLEDACGKTHRLQ